MKIGIIGAGASGLIAAIYLKRKGVDFTLFEREQRAGKKLLATGNGRCNITNTHIDISNYHGEPSFAEFALSEFTNYDLYDFLESVGILCTEEGEKVFPKSLQASSVLDLLRLAEGECEICDTEVLHLKKQKNKIFAVTKDKEFAFDKVIVCCGGKASPKLSGGGAYHLLTELGHTKTPLSPAIVQLKCQGTKALDGIKVNANVKLEKRTESGEVLFTSYGLSGPPILQLSRDAVGKEISLDLIPDLNFKELYDTLCRKRKIVYLTAEHLFTGILPKKLGREILRFCDIMPFSKSIGEISDKEIKSVCSTAKDLKFKITGHNGFENAQVTAGGILCSEFYPTTMESKKVKGVYVAGEVLNIDGDCGGFNLQWAFSSGILAAKSAASEE